MKNVAPKPCFLSRGAATAMCDRLESSKVSTTSLSGIGSNARAWGVATTAETSPRKSGRMERPLDQIVSSVPGKATPDHTVVGRLRLGSESLDQPVEAHRDRRRCKKSAWSTRVIGRPMRLSRSMRIRVVLVSVLGLGVVAQPCTAREPTAVGAEPEGSLEDYL